MFSALFRRLRPWLVGLFALTLGLAIALQSCNATPSASDDFTDRMAQEHQGDQPKPTEITLPAPSQPVNSEMVEYATVGENSVQGFLAQPASADGADPLPGIIAIHEWWGLNDNIKAVAERLAGEGYRVLAVDLYGGNVADKPADARSLMQGVMGQPAPAQENLTQAYEYLTEVQQAPAVGSIGWCFGGAWSLQAGLLLPEELDAAVIYYGRLETDARVLEPLTAPVAGFFGGQDQGIPLESVNAFEATLKELDKTAEIYVYEDADHAFANPSGDRYNADAATDAWAKTTAFFGKYLQTAS